LTVCTPSGVNVESMMYVGMAPPFLATYALLRRAVIVVPDRLIARHAA
jgi:hypothetical protein